MSENGKVTLEQRTPRIKSRKKGRERSSGSVSEVRRLETRYGKLSHRDRIRAFDAEHPGWASRAEGPHHSSSIVKNVTVGKLGGHIRPHRH